MLAVVVVALLLMTCYGAALRADIMTADHRALRDDEAERVSSAEQDKREIAYIRSTFPLPCGYSRDSSSGSHDGHSHAFNASKRRDSSNCYTEHRVISMALYGNGPKYVHGALRNAELLPVYFEGWTLRFYVSADVAAETRHAITRTCPRCQLVEIPQGTGATAGMFWRFLVAADPTVDRYIIRDADSRLNARDRLAVEDWISTHPKYPIHVLRDHPNHCGFSMSGGMWGGVRGALPKIEQQIKTYSNRESYGADMNLLGELVWPEVKSQQIAHDAYCCEKFPNSRPFPSQRPANYQHVGQVFDASDVPRARHIDAFMRGNPAPPKCRGKPEWTYG